MTDISKVHHDYWGFYLQGRQERKLLKTDISPDVIVEKLTTPETESCLRDVLVKAARDAATALQSGRVKRDWMAENASDIKEAGLDPERAFSAWLAGRAEELAYSLEDNVLKSLLDEFDGEDQEDEDDDGEEDEEGDED